MRMFAIGLLLGFFIALVLVTESDDAVTVNGTQGDVQTVNWKNEVYVLRKLEEHEVCGVPK